MAIDEEAEDLRLPDKTGATAVVSAVERFLKFRPLDAPTPNEEVLPAQLALFADGCPSRTREGVKLDYAAGPGQLEEIRDSDT